jgi:hypothetical protein
MLREMSSDYLHDNPAQRYAIAKNQFEIILGRSLVRMTA